MINIWLIILMVVFPVVLLVANIYFIVYYQHPEDKNSSWFAKIVVVLSLELAEICVLMLPLDVANVGPPAGQMPMAILWMIVYCMITVDAVVILPFCMLWYEEEGIDRPQYGKRLGRSLFGTLIVVLVFCIIYVVLYIFLGIAEVSVQKLSAIPVLSAVAEADNGCGAFCASNSAYLAIRISPILFLITEIDAFGYILMIIFGGIGLAALPFDLAVEFKYRPRRMERNDFETQRSEIGRRADALLEIGQLVMEARRRGASGRKERERYNRWRQSVVLLDEDWANLQASFNISGATIILAWVKLFGCVFFTAVTVVWWLHILLYLIVPNGIIPFLNTVFTALQNAWGLLGVLAYALFSFYLLVCTLKGVVKFGMRFFFLLPVYPMKQGDTFMNAFMFNTILAVISAITVTHFCALAFADYITGTAVSSIFVLSIGSLRILRWWFTYAPFALEVIPILTAIYLGIRPRDRVATKKPDAS